MITSGIRFGTAAMTTRGMQAADMDIVAALIDRVISHINDEQVVAQVRAEVVALCQGFPVPAVGDFVGIEV